ncbi:MAG: YHS domain-containing (seleno)protein [Planctomycetota bacterium]
MNKRSSRIFSMLLMASAATFSVSSAAVSADEGGAALVAQDDQKPRDVSLFHLAKKGLALGGYDPVAYFPEGGGKAKKGSKKIESVHDGVRYRFSSEKNRKLFEKNPAHYEPALGGWCPNSLATRNELVAPNHKNFLIQDGRLMVFAKGWFANGRSAWQKNKPSELILKADRYWARRLETRQGQTRF